VIKKKKKPAKKPAARKPRPPAAISVACPSCGAAATQPCLLLVGPMGHRRQLEEALKFNIATVASPALHASRIAAHDRLRAKPTPSRPR
jgi:hypothetical protein